MRTNLKEKQANNLRFAIKKPQILQFDTIWNFCYCAYEKKLYLCTRVNQGALQKSL